MWQQWIKEKNLRGQGQRDNEDLVLSGGNEVGSRWRVAQRSDTISCKNRPNI